MKLTKERLKTIIKEELEAVLKETIAAEGVGRQIQPGGGTIPSCPELAQAMTDMLQSDQMYSGQGGTPSSYAFQTLSELGEQMATQNCHRQELKKDPNV